MLTDLKRKGLSFWKERAIEFIFFLCILLSLITTLGIVGVLVYDTADFFTRIPLSEFLTHTRWSPRIQPVEFGILPLLSGTLFFTFTTALVSLPIGLLAAVYLSEYAADKIRSFLKPALEILAGIPSVVYGYFALVYITPFLRNFIPGIHTFNVLSAALVVGIMIIPTVASISEDAFRAVPVSLRMAGYGLGVNRFRVVTSIVMPAALSGIVSSFILGISRAVGEVMAVTMAAGNLPRLVNLLNLPEALLSPLQTMTAAMVEIGISDVSGESVAYKSLFAIGLLLFLMTLILNAVSLIIKLRFREKYQ